MRSATSVDRKSGPRTLVSQLERRKTSVRWGMSLSTTLLLVVLAAVTALPILWLGKAALSTSRDITAAPFALWPSGVQPQNLSNAWTDVGIGHYLLNTLIVVLGCWLVGLLVATTGGYALSVLRPRGGRLAKSAILATLFIPSIVTLIPQYLIILDLPVLGVSLINTYWAVWLPAGANAFNVLLVTRFFDELPREIFEAARIDHAGPFRLFIWIVLPMSKPVIWVVSLLIVVNAWKDFLWPMLVLPDRNLQPLAVALPRLESQEASLFMAGLFMSVVVPIALFLIFQRQFFRSAGEAGALKG